MRIAQLFCGCMTGLAMVLLSTPAMAGLTGYYEVSNWTVSVSGSALLEEISLSGAPNSIRMFSSDSGGGASNLDFTIAAPSAGLVTFNWVYTTRDRDGSSFDPFGYLLNGVFTQLSSDLLAQHESEAGSTSFFVNTGDVFGFRQHSTDSSTGRADTVISNFSGPIGSSVPEPSSMVLLGIGGIGMGMAAWRRLAVA